MSLSLSKWSLGVAALVAVTFTAEVAAQGGRLSLAERVARLEQSQQGQSGPDSTIELLQRIQELQREMEMLRGLVEQQAFEIEGLKRRQRDQYLDLDTRLSRLEGRPAPTPGSTSEPSAAAPGGFESLPPESGSSTPQVVMELPEVRSEVPSDTETTGLGVSQPIEPTRIVDPAAEKALYDQAFESLQAGRYAESSRRFQSFLEQYPTGEFAGNAAYWLGESYYVTQNYRMALDVFRDLLVRYPTSAKVGDALLKIGYCHYELREWDEAERLLNDVVQRYPDTTLSRLAQGRLRSLRTERR